jgi:hypothetical protein
LGLVRKGLILESANNATTERDKNIRNIVETRYRLPLLSFLSALSVFQSVLGALRNINFASRTVCLLSVKVLKQRAESFPADGFPLLQLYFDFE